MLHHKLILAARFVDRQSPTSDDVESIFGNKTDQTVLHSEARATQGRGLVLEREVPMSGAVSSQVGYFTFDVDINELAFDCVFETRRQFGHRNCATLLHELIEKVQLRHWMLARNLEGMLLFFDTQPFELALKPFPEI